MLYMLDLFGTGVFAITGALAAGRKNLDLFGVFVLATVTAIGGGTLRDMALGASPVFWITDSGYLLVAGGGAILTVLWARFTAWSPRALPVADAVGLATFTVIGAGKALELGAAPEIAVLMGVMTGVAGGMIRDVLCGEVPLVLRKEIYATASIFGGTVFVLAMRFLPYDALSTWLGVAAALALRLAAIHWNLSLPVFTHIDLRSGPDGGR